MKVAALTAVLASVQEKLTETQASLRDEMVRSKDISLPCRQQRLLFF